MPAMSMMLESKLPINCALIHDDTITRLRVQRCLKVFRRNDTTLCTFLWMHLDAISLKGNDLSLLPRAMETFSETKRGRNANQKVRLSTEESTSATF